jgi:hypothetical protein
MFKHLAHWLFVEPRFVWFALLPPALSAGLALGLWQSEAAIRVIGLALQLAGILTVAWGIVETWRFFGLGQPLAPVRAWIRRYPLRKRIIIAAASDSVEFSDAASARGHTSWPLKPTSPIEERVEAIEKNIPLMQDRISRTQIELDNAVRTLQGELKIVATSSNEQVQRVHSQVRLFGTGSLHISAMGALWLFVGSILSTASQELHRWVQ